MAVTGYARPHRADPDSAQRQREQLVSAGADHVVIENPATPAQVRSSADRPRLAALVADIGAGDTLMVTSMDRLARSLPHLVGVVEAVTARGADVVFLAEAIATTGPDGDAVTRTLSALAELERVLRAARTAPGRAAAPRGRGRPRAMDARQVARARAMAADGVGPSAIAAALGVTRPTLHRYLNAPTTAAKADADGQDPPG